MPGAKIELVGASIDSVASDRGLTIIPTTTIEAAPACDLLVVWLARDLLTLFGATVVNDRMLVDGNIFTSGGVTAGIDMAFRVVAEIAGEEAANRIQLQIEYDPEPPFRSGTPFSASPEAVAAQRTSGTARRKIREAAVATAAAALANEPAK